MTQDFSKPTTDEAPSPDHTHPFAKALSKIAKADAASSRAAIEASKVTKPSLHTRSSMTPQRAVLRPVVGWPPYPSTRNR